MSFNGWIVKQIVVDPYHGILLSKRTENKLLIQEVTWVNIQRIMLSEKACLQSFYTLYNSTYITVIKGQNLDMENKLVVARV